MVLPLAIFILFFSLGCLAVSLITLIFALKFTRSSECGERSSAPNEAILITGCDSGIGLAVTKYFYRTTNFKIICGFLKPSESDGFKELEQFKNLGTKRLILRRLDLTNSKDIEDTIKSIQQLKDSQEITDLVGLINNAGVMAFGEFDWLTWDQVMSVIDVNLIGTLKLVKAVLPHIIDSRGRIINVSSVNDMTVFPGLSIYSATKNAISTFSRGIGYEMRKFGVHVVTIRLGDFARLTNIMSNHKTNMDEMWNEMDSRKRLIYSESFKDFNDHLLDNYGMTSPRRFSDSSLYTDFRRALLAKDPPATIVCASRVFRIFYYFIELMPIYIQYHLLDCLMRFGFKWESQNNPTRELANRTRDERENKDDLDGSRWTFF